MTSLQSDMQMIQKNAIVALKKEFTIQHCKNSTCQRLLWRFKYELKDTTRILISEEEEDYIQSLSS